MKMLEHIKRFFDFFDIENKLNTVISNQKNLTSLLERNLKDNEVILASYKSKINDLECLINTKINESFIPLNVDALIEFSNRYKRNFLPNDSSLMQKMMIQLWKTDSNRSLTYDDLLSSGFRVFSQNDEDGIILRIFTQIGIKNHCVVEIGSNCSDSKIGVPENLSSNLICNHGWHGIIFEIDTDECERMRYFFARDLSTKHFHSLPTEDSNYFSPLIISQEITPQNINQLLIDVSAPYDLDLMIIDIDGGDFKIIENLTKISPRVLVVEFEKRFEPSLSLIQSDKNDFSKSWPQSGAASLAAWGKLLQRKGYILCGIANSGFNAFFVRSDIAEGRINQLDIDMAFKLHPIFSKVPSSFWKDLDPSWSVV